MQTTPVTIVMQQANCAQMQMEWFAHLLHLPPVLLSELLHGGVTLRPTASHLCGMLGLKVSHLLERGGG